LYKKLFTWLPTVTVPPKVTATVRVKVTVAVGPKVMSTAGS